MAMSRLSMNKNNILDPDRFELASVVTKNSRSGITSNRRLLAIRGGHLFYYSNIPKFFNGDAKVLEHFHELPKCSIEIVNIKKVNGFEQNSAYFSIEFEAKHMLQREDIRRTLINEQFNFTPKDSKQLIIWQFTCDNQFLKQRWVKALTQLKQHFAKEQAQMERQLQKMRNSLHSPEDRKSSNGSFSSRSSVRIPWRQSGMGRRSFNVQNSKYGFEFKDASSPKSSTGSNKLEESRKKSPSQAKREEDEPDFEMIIKETTHPINIEEAFKISQVAKAQQPKPYSKISHVSQLEEVVEENSIRQTPIKENSNPPSEAQEGRPRNSTLDVLLFPETPKPSQENPIFIENKQKSTPKQSSPILSEQRSKISFQYTQGCDFQRLLGESYRAGRPFEQRLSKQKELLNVMEMFKQRAVAGLSDWIESKSQGQQHFKVTEQSNRQLIVEVGTLQLKVALLTTQNITINEKPRIYFNEESIKNLKRQFKIYQQLFKLLCKKLKQEPTLQIRIPLTVYVQYKGVACLAFDHIYEETAADFDEEEWLTEKTVLLEEGYKLDWFTCRAAGSFLNVYLRTRGKNIEGDDQTLKDYLKGVARVGGEPKNHNLMFEQPIDKTFLELACKENASTSLQSLQKYIKGLKTKAVQCICPKEEIIEALQNCIYCKELRKIYRSAQGEIEETHFFNLVFKQDSSLAQLLEQAGCPPLLSRKGQLLSFIQHYFGVLLEIDYKVYQEYERGGTGMKGKNLVLSSTVHPLIREYPTHILQLVQSFSKLGVYLQRGHELGWAALQRKKQIYHLRGDNLGLGQKLQLLYNEACYYYHQSDYITCIKKCKQYQEASPLYYTQLLPLYLLMMKAYSEFSETQLTLTLNKITQLVYFNYGQQHSTLINIYTLASFYYQQLSQKNKNNKLLQIAIALMKEASQLCTTHFGYISKQYLQNLLDQSRLNRPLDASRSEAYLQQAKTLLQNNPILSTPENSMTVFVYQLEHYLQLGQFSKAETAMQMLLPFKSASVSLNTRKHMARLQYELGFYGQKYSYCEQALQCLWQMGTNEKLQAIESGFRAALRSAGVRESEQLVEGLQLQWQSKQRGLLQLQQEKILHGSLFDLLLHAVESRNNKNNKLLSVIYFLKSKR